MERRDPGQSRRDAVSLAEAICLVDSHCKPVAAEQIPVLEAVGRSLVGSVQARRSVPPFRRAAMDGYAIKVGGTNPAVAAGTGFEIVGDCFPGRPLTIRLRSDQCVRIGTGAPIPAGADTVLRWEIVRLDDNRIETLASVERGKDVARVGEDISASQELLTSPRILRPQDIAACCSAGVERISVVRIPRVSVLATGDELRAPGDDLSFGEIVDTNSIMLKMLVERDRGIVVNWSQPRDVILPDRLETIQSAIVRCVKSSDLILISGGTSHGPADLIARIIADMGELVFRGVKMRPGAPTAFGTVASVPAFLLPGNPVACLAAYDLIARHGLRNLGGHRWNWPYFARPRRLAEPIRSSPGRFDYVRVCNIDNTHVAPLQISGASNLSSTVAADGFVLVDGEFEGLSAGDGVNVHFYETPSDESRLTTWPEDVVSRSRSIL